ncbi:helix-turn-helix domain-containing protein [Palleronia sp. KMU-117]|uniref:helix-turn-helix domain-containing protein n=1 Tax=Palleronia sp. KMU-117 TaxID=3434108 RepID=UPI003D7247EB
MSGRIGPAEEGQSSRPLGFDDFRLRLGDIMRGERATMGKSLLDVQRELKIKATYIAAIENTDPTAFETPGFVAGYVRSYARYLDLDPEWAFRTFCEESGFSVAHGMSAEASGARPVKVQRASKGGARDPFIEPNVSYIPRGERKLATIEPGAIGSMAVLVALIAGIGYGGWAVLQEVQKVRFAPVDQTPRVLSELDPIATPQTPVDGEVTTAEAVTPPSMEALDRLYRPEALDVPVLVARDGPISTLDPRSVGALRSTLPGTDNFAALGDIPDEATPSLLPAPQSGGAPVQVVAEAAPGVVMFAVRPSWVRVRAADGTVIFEKILDSGEEFVIPATEEPARLRAGNAGSVYFRVNGRTFGPAGEGASVVRDVALAPEALSERFAVADLSRDADLARFVAVAEAQTAPDAAPVVSD